MRSFALVALCALCAASTASASAYSSRRWRRAGREPEIIPPKTTANSTEELKSKLEQKSGELATAINRADLEKAADTGKEIAKTMAAAEKKGLTDTSCVAEVHTAAEKLEEAAATGNKKKANEAAKTMIGHATDVALKPEVEKHESRRAIIFVGRNREKSAIEQFEQTMRAMRRALRKDHLFLAAQHADNAADAAALISEESGDRADTAAAATEMKSLAMDMKEAAKHGDAEKAKAVGNELSKVSHQIEHADSSIKKTRSTDADSKQLPTTQADQLLANVSQAAASTKMDLNTFRMDEAVSSAEELKKVASKAAEKQAISNEDAVAIKKAADNVQKAVTSGDHETAIEHAKKLHGHVEEAVMAHKGPEVADKLKKAEEKKNKPVLSTHEEEKILRAAVAEVVEADELVPPEKKEEATDFTVNMIKEGFKRANTTTGDLVTAVEAEAAKQNKTGADRSWFGYPYYGSGYGYPGSYYYPEYYYGYGYNQCLYWSSYPYCLGRLFGDYAHYHGFHHFYHHHHRGGHRG